MSKKTTLVLGASLKPERYSNMAIKKLLKFGHDIKAIGLKSGEVNGVEISILLSPFSNIDTVTLYLNPKRQVLYYDYIVSLRPRRVIFNPGTEDEFFYGLLRMEGIIAEPACTFVLLSTNQY